MDADVQQAFDQIRGEWAAFKANPPLLDHFHTGYDVSRVTFADISLKKIWLFHTIQGTAAATTTNYSTFFIVPAPMTLTGFKEVHAVLGTDGGTVTVTPEKLTGTTAPGSGVVMLATALSLKSTINTVQTGTLTGTLANRSLVAGDRVALKLVGTPTSVANLTVLMELTLV